MSMLINLALQCTGCEQVERPTEPACVAGVKHALPGLCTLVSATAAQQNKLTGTLNFAKHVAVEMPTGKANSGQFSRSQAARRAAKKKPTLPGPGMGALLANMLL